MTCTLPADQIRQEGRLLFALLDAIDADGMMAATPNDGRWKEAKKRIAQSGDYPHDARLFYEMLAEIHSSGALAGTWIEPRWLTVKGRIAGAN